MKGKIRKCRRKIYKRIRNAYRSNKDVLPINPKWVDVLFYAIFISAIVSFVIAMILTVEQNKLLWILFGISFAIFIGLGIVNHLLEKKWVKFREEKTKDIRSLCTMCIEDEAKVLGVKTEELVLYMRCKYKEPIWIKIITVAISILFTAFAVFYFPGFDKETHGVGTFLVLLCANVIASMFANLVNKSIEEIDNFDFYFIAPYSDVFEKIDEQLNRE